VFYLGIDIKYNQPATLEPAYLRMAQQLSRGAPIFGLGSNDTSSWVVTDRSWTAVAASAPGM